MRNTSEFRLSLGLFILLFLTAILLISALRMPYDKEESEVYTKTMPTITVIMPKFANPTAILPPLPSPTPNPDIMYIPDGASSFKSILRASKITDRSSAQYRLLQHAAANDLGFMCIDGQYMVAMGTFYANRIGQQFVVTFEDGRSISVIIGDVKRDYDTINNQYCKENGSIVEFIMSDSLDIKIKRRGDVSILINKGKVTEIRRLG